jgi:hypothetical protein
MEHRWGIRESIDLDVLINHGLRPPICGRLRNISLSGLFVATPSARPPLNAGVELVFVQQERGFVRIHRLEATVTRRVEDGVGLMFSQFHPGELSALRALSHADKNTPLAAIPPPLAGSHGTYPDEAPGRDRLERGVSCSGVE